MAEPLDPLTDEQLAAWQALADAASPPPWRVVFSVTGNRSVWAGKDGQPGCWASEPEDLAFMAAARAAVPALLAEVHRLRAEVAGLRRGAGFYFPQAEGRGRGSEGLDG